MTLEYELSHTKTRYREIFLKTQASMFAMLTSLRDKYACTICEKNGEIPELLDELHADCGYKGWYQEAATTIEKEVGRDVLTALNQIEAYKNTFSCHQCGVCCRLASSEFSYEQLQEKAKNGDSFATQFTSIFLPYASTDVARKKFPDIVGEVTKLVKPQEDVYFYHCPYIGEDNRCTIYGTAKRPAICASYPDTPLTFIYDKCAWRPWKDETHDEALLAHATLELSSFVLGKLKDL